MNGISWSILIARNAFNSDNFASVTPNVSTIYLTASLFPMNSLELGNLEKSVMTTHSTGELELKDKLNTPSRTTSLETFNETFNQTISKIMESLSASKANSKIKIEDKKTDQEKDPGNLAIDF